MSKKSPTCHCKERRRRDNLMKKVPNSSENIQNTKLFCEIATTPAGSRNDINGSARNQNPCEAHRICSLFSIHNSLFTIAIWIATSFSDFDGFGLCRQSEPPHPRRFLLSLEGQFCVILRLKQNGIGLCAKRLCQVGVFILCGLSVQDAEGAGVAAEADPAAP